MRSPLPSHVVAARRQDLLLTLVLLGIGLTPAWLAPADVRVPWIVAVGLLAGPAVLLTWWHAPWQPTPMDEVARVAKLVNLGPSQRFCDLGAGDGRVVRWVRRHTGADATGIEAMPLLWLLSQLRVLGVRGARVHLANLYRADLRSYDVVYVWGTAYSVAQPRFAARMLEAMAPGARLVSYHHEVPGLPLERVDQDGIRPVHVYRMPEGATR